MSPSKAIRAAIRRDPWTKALAIVLASAVWYLTNVRERDAERVVDVPVVTRRVPRGLVVTEWPLERALVTLRGPGPLLDGVDERRSRLVVPLAGIDQGENQIDLKSARFEPDLPGNLSVVRIQPGRVTMVAAVLAKRMVPVQVVTTGKVPAGYRLGRIESDPEHVEVAGPVADVEGLDTVRTATLSLDELTASYRGRLLLEWAGDFVTFLPDRVAVHVDVEETPLTRKIDAVAIAVRGATGFRLEPPTVSLTLRAPTSVLDTFTLPPQAVYVDATGLAPGVHQVAVTIALPPEGEVVSRQPEVHRLVVEEARGNE
jgi:hypothetical protein